ncbi:MAG TPA: prolyl oligopeptidase family serine peptidase [Gemmatimonadaceae bacterium]|nr:prolyl oligopeptidase family serine peptidase [Gemmatimonadaceae bacterium]
MSASRITVVATTIVALAGAAQAQNAPAASATQTAAKGRAISAADIRQWNTLRGSVLSSDGKWFAYVVGNTESDGKLIVRGTAQNSRTDTINVGASGGSPQISGDSKWLGYLVTPNRPPTGRGGRAGTGRAGTGAGGGRGGDSTAAPAADTAANANQAKLVLRNLATGTSKEFERVRRFSFNSETPTWVVMQGGGGPAGIAGGGPPGIVLNIVGGAPGASSGGGAPVILYNLAADERFNLGMVSQYAFNESGDLLAYTMDNPEQLGNALQLRDMKTGVARPIDSEDVLYRHLAWIDSSRALAVMKGKIATTGARDTVFSISVFRGISAEGKPTKLSFTPEGRADFPTGWKVASERAPRYSTDLTQVFFGIREGLRTGGRGAAGRGNSPLVTAGAPGAGGSINQTAAGRGASGNAAADSTPSLILWHGRDPRLQSQQIVQEAADRSFNYLVSYRFADNKFVRLTDDSLRNVTIVANDKFAYGADNAPYQQAASYNGRNFADVYTVDLKTGARKLLWKKRLGGALQPSPDGTKAMFWGVDGNYWVLDLATLDSVNITKGVATSFVNTEDDHNWIVPPQIGSRGWSKDNKYVILSDNWDLWRVPVKPGSEPALNLTVNGKKDQIRYRQIFNWAEDEDDDTPDGGGGRGGRGGGRGGGGGAGVDLTKPLYISTYGEWTKKEGVSRVDPGKAGAQSLLFEDARFGFQKARNADVFAYTRQTFVDFPDMWILNNRNFTGGYQVTNINPQIKDLAWSSGTRLIDYKSDKGDKLQGALYLPANYEPGKKYPLLVTIYEKRSQNKNGFVAPSETATPSARMYTSRGYAVLDPDIVYKINDPGMSAVWAVVPAVKAAIATGIIDEKNVGLWGHSWGGYQTAFLVTQTNVFKAAVAGAALTDMVSMYNSVYWNTGGSNQAIFEASQGRFKGNVAENFDAYIRNSPVFHAQKVTTPLMLLHNDKDGAVDFNQGITYFNALRQLGKEVIMLEYVGENHGVARPVNQRDYAQRMTEWFDHYLMGKPAPDWMKEGIPRLKMAEHLAGRRDSVTTPVIRQ